MCCHGFVRLGTVRKLAGLRQRDLPTWQRDGLIALSVLMVAVLTPIGLITGLLAGTHDLRVAVIVTLAVVPFVITPVWWAAHVRRRRANAAQLARIAELDRRVAVAAERGRMARDLHDVIAGHLSAIAIQSGAVLSVADDARTARTVLTSVRQNSVHALEEMRAMIGLLRDDAETLADETTAPARLAELSRLVASARAGGMRVTVESTVDDERLPVAIDLTAYRIAQEALTNTMKHAPGGQVRIEISRCGDKLTVEVHNDLRADHVAREPDGRGHGLLNMRARADAVGGTLSAGPVGGGWLVRAELPVAEGPA
jgi:signal transduction histidine kinase